MRWRLWALAAAVSVLSGCGSQYAMRCENPERYADERQAPPVRVPDDLSVPDETEALRIPPPVESTEPKRTERRGPCLESPPSYFEGEAANGATAPTAEEGQAD